MFFQKEIETMKRSELEGLEGGATGLRFVLSVNLTEIKS